MTNRRPRLVLSLAAVALAGVLAAFAVAIVRSAGADRDRALERFVERADVTGALTESLFESSARLSATELEGLFGGPDIDERLLAQRAEQAAAPALVVVGPDGEVLGSAGGRELAERIAGTDAVRQVLASGGYRISDFVEGAAGRGGGVVYAVGFEGRDGRRAYVQTLGSLVLQTFLGEFLRGIPDAATTHSFVLDSQGRVVASAASDQAVGEPVDEPGLLERLGVAPSGEFEGGDGMRTFVSSQLASTTWRVVLTRPTDVLYAGISTSVEWLILVALGLAGAATVASLYRTMRAAGHVRLANARLEEANTELARSNLELQRSNSELEQFASVASHDLQEPLRKVQTFGDQLERRFGDEIPEEGLDYVRRMRKAAVRMSVLIDDLLRFSRVTTRARPPERVDLDRVAADVVSDLETAISEAHAEVRIGPLPIVEADPAQMRQLVQNLLTNAIKFTRPGVAPAVSIEQTRAPAGSIAFAVRDNGIGIEEQYSERIFRVFERLHPRDVYEGTGIGLALCRKIADRHGGTIDVESVPGEGSTFTVTLPARTERSARPPEPAAGYLAGETRSPARV